MPQTPNKEGAVSRYTYYSQCRALAQSKRIEHSIKTETLNLNVMNKVYKTEGIIVDRKKLKGNRIKAAYYCDDGNYSVLVNSSLPREPRLFAMAHELKHHYLDQEQILNGQIECGDYNANELIEKGGEVFAAEFIYPEHEMRQLLGQMKISTDNCTSEGVVRLKRACPACVSYTFLIKRLTRFGVCEAGAFKKVQFQKLEEEMFGLPIYKRPSFKTRREQKRSHREIPF